MKVFVSSTCYDLIDIRAEIEQLLLDLNLQPVMSDRLSDFDISPNPTVSSIDTCLENVRTSNTVLVILSQRYGPPLPSEVSKEGYSATHLEYLEARKHDIPTFFYVRDQLAGEYHHHRKDNTFKPSWADRNQYNKLFAFIGQRQPLVDAAGRDAINNWYTTFKSSIDLKSQIKKDLKVAADNAAALRSIETGQCPILVVAGQEVRKYNVPQVGRVDRFKFVIVNAGPIPAINVVAHLKLEGATVSSESAKISTIIPGDDLTTRQTRTIEIDVAPAHLPRALGSFVNKSPDVHATLQIGYMTPSGQIYHDCSRIVFHADSNGLEFSSMPIYIGKTSFERRSFAI